MLAPMNDRRGHGKLRLTSRKYFKPKPKQPTTSSVTSDPVPAVPVSLNVTLPLNAYTDAVLVSMDNLHNRLKRCEVIPSGNLN